MILNYILEIVMIYLLPVNYFLSIDLKNKSNINCLLKSIFAPHLFPMWSFLTVNSTTLKKIHYIF